MAFTNPAGQTEGTEPLISLMCGQMTYFTADLHYDYYLQVDIMMIMINFVLRSLGNGLITANVVAMLTGFSTLVLCGCAIFNNSGIIT